MCNCMDMYVETITSDVSLTALDIITTTTTTIIFFFFKDLLIYFMYEYSALNCWAAL